MSRARVKVCGITRSADARVAAGLGADYIGVIFAESPRRVDLERAREIRAAVPHTPLVGVFRDQLLDEVVRLAREADVDLVQLHGGESPAYCDDVLARAGRPVIKAFDAAHLPDNDALARYRTASYFLFDLEKTTDGGDADAAGRVWAEVARTRRRGFRVFVAGALDPSNVREAIRRSHAFAVDVCRGVEQAPGVKDPSALQRFMAEARA